MPEHTILLEHLVQRSDEWHQWREQRRTASHASTIVGAAPAWMTQAIDEYSEVMMEHGEDAEPKIALEVGWHLDHEAPPMCVERQANPLHAASLDGLSVAEWWEIKAPATGRDSATWRAAVNKRVVEHHWWQLAHHALALGVLDGEDSYVCRFIVAVEGTLEFDPGHVIELWVEGDPWSVAAWTWPISVFAGDAAILEARYALDAAGDHVGKPLKRPGRPLDIENPDEVAQQWIDTKTLSKALVEREKLLKADVLHMHERGIASPLVKVSESKRRASVKWRAVAENFAPEGTDLDEIGEEYRGDPTVVTSLRVAKR